MKKFNIKKFIIFIILFITFLICLAISIFFFMLSAKDNNKEQIKFEIAEGKSYYDVADDLEKQGIIRSALFLKVYLKLNNINKIEAGTYLISSSNSAKEIVEIFNDGVNINTSVVNITIPEGKHITDIASFAAKLSERDASYYLNVWQSDNFIDTVIEKYWFITDEIKDKDIKYALEGYFFPSTYELASSDETPEYIAYKLLDQMEKILNKYKEEIDKSKYSIHEILTMASIVEHEAILDEDRPIIASVFYNRLKANMRLESCATLGYAIDDWKLSYSEKDKKSTSPYNTYKYSGLTPGPANSPSEKSIQAAINPSDTKYYYFLADVCSENPKTYFSKNYNEHLQKKRKYLGCL